MRPLNAEKGKTLVSYRLEAVAVLKFQRVSPVSTRPNTHVYTLGSPSAKKFSFYKRKAASRENTNQSEEKETKKKEASKEVKENRKGDEKERGITLELEKGYAVIRGIGGTEGNDVTSLLRGPNSNHAKPIAYTALRVVRTRTHLPLSLSTHPQRGREEANRVKRVSEKRRCS